MDLQSFDLSAFQSGDALLFRFSKGAHANTCTKEYVPLYARIDRLHSIEDSLTDASAKLNLFTHPGSVVNYYLWHEGTAHLVRSSRS